MFLWRLYILKGKEERANWNWQAGVIHKVDMPDAMEIVCNLTYSMVWYRVNLTGASNRYIPYVGMRIVFVRVTDYILIVSHYHGCCGPDVVVVG